MEPNTKLYYDTNEVAAMVGCEASALRFWEKKFPQLAPKRDSRNRRRYTERDIEVIRKIMHQKDKQGRRSRGARADAQEGRVAADDLQTDKGKGFSCGIEGIIYNNKGFFSIGVNDIK